MVGILLMAHEPLATAFLSAATHVFRATPEHVCAVDVLPDQDIYEVNQLASEALQKINSGRGVLILTDICGATPANCAQRLVDMNGEIQLVFGLNLSVLLRALTYRDLPLAQLVQKTIEGGKNGVFHYQSDSSSCLNT